MAEFTVEYQAAVVPGPQYDDYFVGVQSICSDDARTHPIKFNDNVTGDYVVGWNWTNPNGLPVGTIQIESFTDGTEVIELSTGNVVPSSVPSNTLKDTSTGLDLTYPYTINISQLPNITENLNSYELTCHSSGSDKYRNTRIRKLRYVLFDTAGNPGPTRIAIYQNTGP